MARRNIENANGRFDSLAQDSSYTCLVDHALYYRVVERGEGPEFNHPASVLIDYEIYDPADKCLSLSQNEWVDLKDMLPAFVWALKGMKEGETREIYIHPSHAYGVHTLIEKGIYLRSMVKLHVQKGEDVNLEKPTSYDLAFVLSDDFYNLCVKKHINSVRSLGQFRAQFLRTFPQINLATVATILSTLNDYVLTLPEQTALNQLFWDKYFIVD